MSRLVVIEDTLETQLEVVAAIKGTEHSNVRTVWDLPQAHQTLIDLALGDLEADYLLVDGNLGARASDNLEFRFTPPGMELPPSILKLMCWPRARCEKACAQSISVEVGEV